MLQTPSFNPEARDEDPTAEHAEGKLPSPVQAAFPRPQRTYNAAATSMIYISLREYLDLHLVLDCTYIITYKF